MRRLKTIPALLFVILLALAFLLTPQSWVDAATGRLSDLRATTLELANGRPLLVAVSDGTGSASSALDDMVTALGSIKTATEAAQAVLEALAPSTSNTGPISITDAATTELIPLAAGEVIDVHLWIIVGGTNTLTFKYGTGTNCGTGTANLSGAMTFGIAGTNPPGSVVPFTIHVPSGQAFCLTTSSGEDVVGLMSYVQY